LEISTATLFLFKKTYLSSEKLPEGRECRKGNISIEKFFPYAQYELYFATEKKRTYRQNLIVVFTLKALSRQEGGQQWPGLAVHLHAGLPPYPERESAFTLKALSRSG
jgi:hypothetical protein